MPHHLDINAEATLDFSALEEDVLSAAVSCHVETTVVVVNHCFTSLQHKRFFK